MNYAINLLSVIPMRKEPAHRSEMVSQLLFGEYVDIFDEQGDFTHIKCLYDDYSGWVQSNQLTPVTAEKIPQTSIYVADWSNEVLLNGTCVNVPFGCPVYSDNSNGSIAIGKNEFQYVAGANWDSNESDPTESALEKVFTKFMNTPYLWGGKSVFGIDCSGFAQQVYKFFGIKLLRDAYLQATQGKEVKFEDAEYGDLAFFHNEKGKIVHVGIVLNSNQIVHASGKVRIDAIDNLGIVNRETGKRTHHLHSVRTYF